MFIACGTLSFELHVSSRTFPIDLPEPEAGSSAVEIHVCNMKNLKKPNNNAKNGKFKPGSKKRENKCIVSFDANDRQDYLTGFHKRKVERRKVAVAEIKKKIKEEQIRVREERHKEYLRLLKERTDALEECEEDDLEDVITATTESVQYDHPNHTVTVTTISDLDLSGAHLLGPAETE
ncbi:Nucleolar protein 12, partial [Dissostichus eleginoides]